LKKALTFFLEAEAGKYKSFVNGADYRISTVRYFGNGEEEADYSGQPTRNIEIDGWGMVLWAARSYVDASGDTEWLSETTRSGETVYDVLAGGVADAIAANLEETGMMIADASIWEVFLPLMAGATVVLAKPGGHQESAYLVQLLLRREVTVLQLVPSMLRVVLEEPDLPLATTLRRVFCGGEALPADLAERFSALLPGAELHNLYGPTEAAIDAAHWGCLPGSTDRIVPIGTPIGNVRIHLLDARLRPVHHQPAQYSPSPLLC